MVSGQWSGKDRSQNSECRTRNTEPGTPELRTPLYTDHSFGLESPGTCAEYARWLGYVPWDRIVDERNERPHIFVPELIEANKPKLTDGIPVHAIFNADFAMPSFSCEGCFPVVQPYRIVLFGEKTSLSSILLPIAITVQGEMLLPTGEASSTMVAELVERAALDHRPTRVLYFSDFDPAGHQMAISVSRKLQALRDSLYPELDICLYPVALTLEQVMDLDLPSTPLKEEEKRADDWRAAWGFEQTEIDAAIALNPSALKEIAWKAVEPFYDDTLKERIKEAEEEWQKSADEQLEAHPAYNQEKSKVQAALDKVRIAARELHLELHAAKEALSEVEPPEIDLPQPIIEAEPSTPLFTTEENFLNASLRLIHHKRYRRFEYKPLQPKRQIRSKNYNL